MTRPIEPAASGDGEGELICGDELAPKSPELTPNTSDGSGAVDELGFGVGVRSFIGDAWLEIVIEDEGLGEKLRDGDGLGLGWGMSIDIPTELLLASVASVPPEFVYLLIRIL